MLLGYVPLAVNPLSDITSDEAVLTAVGGEVCPHPDGSSLQRHVTNQEFTGCP